MKQNSFLNSQYLNNSVKYTAFILYCFSSKLKVVLSRLLRTRKPYRVQSLVLRMSPSQGQPYGLSAGTGNATCSPPLLPPRQPRKKTSCSSQPPAASSSGLALPFHSTASPLSSCTHWFNAFPPSLLQSNSIS